MWARTRSFFEPAAGCMPQEGFSRDWNVLDTTSLSEGAQATILTSEPRARRPGEPGRETAPHIVYEYTAGGRTHRSHQLRGVPLGASELPHFLSRYPAGATAQVYYNPADPQEAVLEREPLSLSAERLGCSAAFTTAVVVALVHGLAPLHRLVSRWFPHAESEDVLVSPRAWACSWFSSA